MVQAAKATGCKACGSTKLPIVYGLPSDRAMAAAERGELRLGGCALPHWPTCRRCGNTLAESDAAPQRLPRVPGLLTAPLSRFLHPTDR